MTMTIPDWLIWLLGIAGGLIVLGLAFLGVMFIWAFKDGIYK